MTSTTFPFIIETADFKDIGTVRIDGENMSIPLMAVDDEVSLEYEETITVTFHSDIHNLADIGDLIQEFVRDETTVTIIDIDRKRYHIECIYV